MNGDLRYCRSALPKVSRTFAQAIRILPPSLNRPVLVAYLLCRVADTVEDDTSLPPQMRVDALRELARAVSGGTGALRVEGILAQLAGMSSWRREDDEAAAGWELAARVRSVLACLEALREDQRDEIAACLRDMTEGMARFVAMEARSAGPAAPAASRAAAGTLETAGDLEAYSDCVAGRVGRFLYGLFVRDLRIAGEERRGRLLSLATPFGLGLQYTNILQDVAADRRRGWIYLPRSAARARGVDVEDLFDPAHRDAAVAVVKDLAATALGYLDKAFEFTLLIPRRAPRVRLFCLMPLCLAAATLTALWGNRDLMERKVKVGRPEVRRLARAALLRCASNGALARFYETETRTLRARVEAHGVPMPGLTRPLTKVSVEE